MILEQKLKRAIKSNNISIIHSIFEEIYIEYGKLVYFTIMQYVNNNMDIEDLTQDVFINFYSRIQKEDIRNIKYYLVVSAKNKAINFLRTQKNNIVYDEQLIGNLEYKFNSNENYCELILKMNKYISNEEIDIIIKHVIYEYTFNEISNMYNKPINTIISMYYRAIRKYKKGVKKNE